jgi:hypothetical protein
VVSSLIDSALYDSLPGKEFLIDDEAGAVCNRRRAE